MMLENQNRQLVHQLEDLRNTSQMFQQQIFKTEKELDRERKINKMNSKRMEEMQKIIEMKTLESNQLNGALIDCESRLDQYLKENQQLSVYVQKCEVANKINDEQTNFCHDEINCCLNNLQELKEKMKNETELVNQKVAEYAKLKEEYNKQCYNVQALKQEIDNLNIYHKEEIMLLKNQVFLF